MMMEILRILYQGIILIQAELLALLQPAQWLGLNKNRAHVVWTIKKRSPQQDEASQSPHAAIDLVLLALRQLESAPSSLRGRKRKQIGGFHIVKAARKQSQSVHQGIFQAWFLTKRFQWVDKMNITLLPTAGGSTVIAEAWSSSTSLLPASFPFAPIFALLVWWIPFDDHYQNYAHLRDIRRHLGFQGYDVEENVFKRGHCIYSFDNKMGKDVGIDSHTASSQ